MIEDVIEPASGGCDDGSGVEVAVAAAVVEAKPRAPRRRGLAPQAPAGPGLQLPDLGLVAPAAEAALLTAERPLSAARLAGIVLAGPPGDDQAPAPEAVRLVQAAVTHLNAQYEATGRSFRIEEVAGGYRVMTLPRFAPVVGRLRAQHAKAGLSPAAIETLAIIAYKQPLTRAHLEAIRGVACGEVLRTLIDRRLVTICGRAPELGRPMLYATTRQFLETFGLASLRDLPTAEDLRQRDEVTPATPVAPADVREAGE